MSVDIRIGDCREILKALVAGSVQCCVTSPPYFGLRDYGVSGQIGLEQTPDAFVAELVAVFREVRRVLADDGTLWLNLGDSYAASGRGGNPDHSPHQMQRENRGSISVVGRKTRAPVGELKPKDLIGIPWRVAFALQADGWTLRSDIIWHKPNPMPESVTDRPTKAHEYLFLLSKSPTYYYNSDAIAEPVVRAGWAMETRTTPGNPDRDDTEGLSTSRNRRSVWSVATHPFSEAHFATFPPKLIEPCILAGSKPGDTILDPFGGAGTTGLVADRHHRHALLIELNPEYAAMARRRITDDAPLFADGAA